MANGISSFSGAPICFSNQATDGKRFLRSSRADEKKLAVLSKHLAEHTAHAVAAAKEDTTDLRFSGADEAILREMVPELSQEVAPEVPRDAGGETAQAYREAFLNVVRSHYSSAITKGILPRTSESARLLLSSVDVAMDSAPEILKDWAFIHDALEAPKNQLARLAGEYSMDETMQKSYCVLSFLEAHRQAREDLPRCMACNFCLALVDEVWAL
ncbi:NHX7 [Symbiodinium sp. CCMP2592]|nr:NHX7 [Symbiodinium sp. CCMP2592]